MKAHIYIKSALLFVALALASCGQALKKQEQSFIQELNELLTMHQDGTYSDEVIQSIFDLIKNNPQSINYEFDKEFSDIRIATSEDGNVRAYNLERCGFHGNPSLGFE